MHHLGITLLTDSARADVEKHAALFTRAGLLAAQAKSREALATIASQIRPRMTEVEGRAVVQDVLAEMGSPRSWHPPVVRIGKNTTLTFFQDRNAIATLGEEDVFYVDIGPNWVLAEFPGLELEGDVGETFVVGNDEARKKCVAFSKELHTLGCRYWKEKKPPGNTLYEWLAKTASDRGYRLLLDDDGHRISEFPHKAYFKEGLKGIGFVPASDLWILEIHVMDERLGIGAFYEDVLS